MTYHYKNKSLKINTKTPPLKKQLNYWYTFMKVSRKVAKIISNIYFKSNKIISSNVSFLKMANVSFSKRGKKFDACARCNIALQ